MIVEYTRYKIDEGRRRTFERTYHEATRLLAASVHCRAYELSRCTEDENHYVLRIEWDSEEGHFVVVRIVGEMRDSLLRGVRIGHSKREEPTLEVA